MSVIGAFSIMPSWKDYGQSGSYWFVRRIIAGKRACVAFFRFALKDRCSSTQQSGNRVPEADFRVMIVGISVSKHSNYWQILDKQLYWQGRLASAPVVCVL